MADSLDPTTGQPKESARQRFHDYTEDAMMGAVTGLIPVERILGPAARAVSWLDDSLLEGAGKKGLSTLLKYTVALPARGIAYLADKAGDKWFPNLGKDGIDALNHEMLQDKPFNLNTENLRFSNIPHAMANWNTNIGNILTGDATGYQYAAEQRKIIDSAHKEGKIPDNEVKRINYINSKGHDILSSLVSVLGHDISSMVSSGGLAGEPAQRAVTMSAYARTYIPALAQQFTDLIDEEANRLKATVPIYDASGKVVENASAASFWKRDIVDYMQTNDPTFLQQHNFPLQLRMLPAMLRETLNTSLQIQKMNNMPIGELENYFMRVFKPKMIDGKEAFTVEDVRNEFSKGFKAYRGMMSRFFKERKIPMPNVVLRGIQDGTIPDFQTLEAKLRKYGYWDSAYNSFLKEPNGDEAEFIKNHPSSRFKPMDAINGKIDKNSQEWKTYMNEQFRNKMNNLFTWLKNDFLPKVDIEDNPTRLLSAYFSSTAYMSFLKDAEEIFKRTPLDEKSNLFRLVMDREQTQKLLDDYNKQIRNARDAVAKGIPIDEKSLAAAETNRQKLLDNYIVGGVMDAAKRNQIPLNSQLLYHKSLYPFYRVGTGRTEFSDWHQFIIGQLGKLTGLFKRFNFALSPVHGFNINAKYFATLGLNMTGDVLKDMKAGNASEVMLTALPTIGQKTYDRIYAPQIKDWTGHGLDLSLGKYVIQEIDEKIKGADRYAIPSAIKGTANLVDRANAFYRKAAELTDKLSANHAVFERLNNSALIDTAGRMFQKIKKMHPYLSDSQAKDIAAQISNIFYGNLNPRLMNEVAREWGRAAIMARNWTYSNFGFLVPSFLMKISKFIEGKEMDEAYPWLSKLLKSPSKTIQNFSFLPDKEQRIIYNELGDMVTTGVLGGLARLTFLNVAFTGKLPIFNDWQHWDMVKTGIITPEKNSKGQTVYYELYQNPLSYSKDVLSIFNPAEAFGAYPLYEKKSPLLDEVLTIGQTLSAIHQGKAGAVYGAAKQSFANALSPILLSQITNKWKEFGGTAYDDGLWTIASAMATWLGYPQAVQSQYSKKQLLMESGAPTDANTSYGVLPSPDPTSPFFVPPGYLDFRTGETYQIPTEMIGQDEIPVQSFVPQQSEQNQSVNP